MCLGTDREQGFTLIEIIISLILLGGIYAGVLKVVGEAARVQTSARQSVLGLAQVETALTSIGAALQQSLTPLNASGSTYTFSLDGFTVEGISLDSQGRLLMGPANAAGLLLTDVTAFSIRQGTASDAGEAPIYHISLTVQPEGLAASTWELSVSSRSRAYFGSPRKRLAL